MQYIICLLFGFLVGFGIGVIFACKTLLETKNKNLQRQYTEVWNKQR